MNSSFKTLEGGRAPRKKKGQNAGGAARKMKGRRANLWFFHSTKRNRLLCLTGDVVFGSALRLEMDPRVRTYWSPDDDNLEADGSVKSSPTLLWVEYIDGSREAWHCSRERTTASDEFKAQCGSAPIVMRTIDMVLGERVLLDNAMQLCAAMTAARDCDIALEYRVILTALRAQSPLTLGHLVQREDVDPGLAFAAFARLLVQGEIVAELDAQLLSLHLPVALAKGGRV